MAIVSSVYQPLGRNDPLNPGKERPHHGVDFKAPIGSPIYAQQELQVVKNSYQFNGITGWGNYVDMKDSSGTIHKIAHLDEKPNLRPGDIVSPGQVIGYTGNSGGSTGPHLHYEVIKNGKNIDPDTLKNSTPLSFTPSGGTLFNTLPSSDKNRMIGTPPVASADPIGRLLKEKEKNDPINELVKRKEESRTQPQNKNKSGRSSRLVSGSPLHTLHDGTK